MEQHYNDTGMHMGNSMWHYFGGHQIWTWSIGLAIVVLAIWTVGNRAKRNKR